MVRPHLSILLLLLTNTAVAQERPEKLPAAPKNQAQHHYAEGVLQVKRGLFLDAVKSFEACLKLDADALPPRRMLATHYVTIGRPDEALAMARAVTERAPGDFDAWQVYAARLKELDRTKEAIEALAKATSLESIKKSPEQQLLLLNRLGGWSRAAGDDRAAVAALRQHLDVLEANRAAFRDSSFLSDDSYLKEKSVTWERLGESLLKLSRLDEALAAFEKARAVFDGRDDVSAKLWRHRLHWHVARVQHQRGDDSAALELLQEYLTNVTPGSIEPYRLFAEVALKADPSGAGRRLAAYARDENNLPLQLLLAETYARAGQESAAEEFYLKLAKVNPRPEVYRGLFGLYERAGRYHVILQLLDEHCIVLDSEGNTKEARKKATDHVRSMSAALLKSPKTVNQLLPLADQELGQQWFRRRNNKYLTFDRLLDLAVRVSDLDETERLLRNALQGVRGGGRAREWLAHYDDALLRVLLARRKYDDAKSLCRERLPNAGNNLFLYNYYLGQALLHLGDLDEALQVNEQTFELTGNEAKKVRVQLIRADILHLLDRPAEALKLCEEMLKEFPQPNYAGVIRLKTATLLAQQRRFAESEKILRQMLESDPNDVQVLNTLGYELADQNRRLDEAERMIRRALELDRRARAFGESEDAPADDHNAAYVDSLAWVLFRQGKLAQARALLEKATAQRDGREEPTLWDHLGDIRAKMGDPGKARIAWENAKRFYEREPLAKKDGRLAEVERKLKLIDLK